MRIGFLFFAVLASLGVLFGVYSLLSTDDAPREIVQEPRIIKEEVATKDVYVALEPIATGDVIDQAKLDRQPWPAHLIGETFIVAEQKDSSDIIGMVARASFQAGEVIMRNKLANPNNPGFLAGQLPEGMRAVTISTNPIAGLAGLLYPGDRVDVLFTHDLYSKADELAEKRRKSDSQSRGSRGEQAMFEAFTRALDNQSGNEEEELEEKKKFLTETLLADVRVLAVNQKAVITGDEKPRDMLPSSITLEVPQQDAQRLRLAEREGELSVVLRSLHDDKIEYARPVAGSDLTRAQPPEYFERLYGEDGFLSEIPAEERRKESFKNRVYVIRGVEVEEIEFDPAQ